MTSPLRISKLFLLPEIVDDKSAYAGRRKSALVTTSSYYECQETYYATEKHLGATVVQASYPLPMLLSRELRLDGKCQEMLLMVADSLGIELFMSCGSNCVRLLDYGHM